jgi:hypothetical protein
MDIMSALIMQSLCIASFSARALSMGLSIAALSIAALSAGVTIFVASFLASCANAPAAATAMQPANTSESSFFMVLSLWALEMRLRG